MQHLKSPPSSPAYKRQRLSSPTYEDQLGDLTQEDLAAFDAIEAQLAQETIYNKVDSGGVEREGIPIPSRNHFQEEPSSSLPISGYSILKNTEECLDDPDNPFSSAFSCSVKAPALPHSMGFTTASSLPSTRNSNRSPSPEALSLERNYDDWFRPAPTDLSTAFVKPVFTKGSLAPGFAKPSGSLIVPSEAALAKAKAKIAAWEKEDALLEGKKGDSADYAFSSDSPKLSSVKNARLFQERHSPKRPALSTISSILNTPDTPSPAFSKAVALEVPQKGMVSSLLSQRHAAFRSPLPARLPASAQPNFCCSPLNPNRNVASVGFTSASSNPHPLSSTLLTAAGPSSTLHRSSISTPTMRTRPAKFVTPFKPNMRPGEPGGLVYPQIKNPIPVTAPKNTTSSSTSDRIPKETTSRKTFFSLNPPSGRKKLATSGFWPQQYDTDDFESFGIDIKMLNQITPETAVYYVFHNTTRNSKPKDLGPPEALKELHDHGCTLATKPWVDNHWCLILWKLAGMVVLDPEKEVTPEMKRWSWTEVIRQLLYRYERELNSGVRPPLRKIANQDVPASFPMVLCVSNIFWSPSGITEDGLPIEPHPELEITDGWYRLRAQVDLPLARAVRRGILRVGGKIGVAGARLLTERKEPSEIMDAYNSTKLMVTANSSQLMPWHFKLGFMRGPCISTLHKLNADGGIIAALDFVIVKLYPIAFLEFLEEEDGTKRREGPRNEAEESRVHEQWTRRREKEATKLREEHDKKYCRYESYMGRLEAKAGSQLKIIGDEPADDIEILFDKLEYPEIATQALSQVTPIQAFWLARHIRQHVEMGRQVMGDEIERELQFGRFKQICPARDVRSFRVLVVQDARTLRRPANRTAQLTVWDVLSLTLDEGSEAGNFACGQRYLALNLIPSQLSAWMGCEPGSEIYLSTRRDTKWTKIKTIS